MTASTVMATTVRHAFVTAVIAMILALPLAGVHIEDGIGGIVIENRLAAVGVAGLLIFIGRFLWGAVEVRKAYGLAALLMVAVSVVITFPTVFLQTAAIAMGVMVILKTAFLIWRDHVTTRPIKTVFEFINKRGNPYRLSLLLIVLTVLFPLTPLASRYVLDVALMVLTYIMLAWGLNVTVGYAGLLDLGYAGFYALGAYSTALLATRFGLGFWMCLPIAGLLAAATALILGAPVLRLRGDYFAVVTLGFGEIVRLVLTNWTSLTGGPNGITDIPRPTLFGLVFARSAANNQQTFANFFHVPFDPSQRGVFLYYIILFLALVVGWVTQKLRRLPLGRAWESFREDEIACASLGINSTGIKLAAYSLGALVAGLAGAFFSARQGFVSPESFTFTESATILAIVILGGVGHPIGIVLASVFIIGLPELFREFEQYRMIAFGLGMVLIMVWRPGGLMATREPAVVMGKQMDGV